MRTLARLFILGMVVGLGMVIGAIHAGAAEEAPIGKAGGKTHLRIADPASLSGARAEEVYRSIRTRLQADYAESGDPIASAYQNWRRYNVAPYRSKAHGSQFVNNYTNEAGRAYGRFEQSGKLPAGSLVVKDSFIVTEAGEIKTGSLFLMEKMPAGYRPADGDWRYMEIDPAGNVVGLSGSPTAGAIAFCADCHNRARGRDHLFFMPESVRIEVAD